MNILVCDGLQCSDGHCVSTLTLSRTILYFEQMSQTENVDRIVFAMLPDRSLLILSLSPWADHNIPS